MTNSQEIALITGITGMVGSHLADYLLKHTDWHIYGMCRWRSPFDNISHLLKDIEEKNRIELIYGDLNDYASLQNVLSKSKPDYVFHLAAQSYPKTSFESPIETLNTNVIGTNNLLEVIRKSESSHAMIHVCASSEVFGRVSKEKTSYTRRCNIPSCIALCYFKGWH